MIEIERRYIIKDPASLILRLAKAGIEQLSEQRVIDQWFIPREIKSLEQQADWFDNRGGVAYRIRRKNNIIEVESKQLVGSGGDHSTQHEETIDINNYDEALEFMRNKDLRNWLTIDKIRRIFDADNPNLSIVLDQISGLYDKIGFDTMLEIEYTGDSDEEAFRIIDECATRIGLTSDQLANRGLAVYAAQELADFEI